jgi:hypothetical protein
MKHRPYYDVPISEIKIGDLIRLARYENSRTFIVKGIKRLPDGYTLTVESPRSLKINHLYFDLNKRIYRGKK